MIKSKEWNWEVVYGDGEKRWLEPSIESYYLINRWSGQGKKVFLDLGCGIGRHTILFAQNGFKTKGFDLSKNALLRTSEYAKSAGVEVELEYGDMLNLPYEDASIECILCRNVISHTDTEGMIKIASELFRVLKDDGECYLTLGSKQTWGFQQTDWPLVDPNTRIRMDEGPEKFIPHFYADYDLIKELFANFKIELIYQVEDFDEKNGKVFSSMHYHILIKKPQTKSNASIYSDEKIY